MRNEKNVLIFVDDIKNRVSKIDREISEIYERERRDGRLPDREYLAELRDEKFTLKEVLEVIAEFPLDEIQEELDKRDPMREELGEDGLGSFSFYVLAHAEKVLQHEDKELQARVDLGERVIAQWEKEFKNLSWEEDQAVYGIIRDKDVPFERLEEKIRQCLIRMNKDLQDDLCDIGGRRCLLVDEWRDGEDVFVLGNAVNEGEFYYSAVNGKISNCFEYDFRPSREQVVDDWMNQEAMREIDRQEALAQAWPGDRDEVMELDGQKNDLNGGDAAIADAFERLNMDDKGILSDFGLEFSSEDYLYRLLYRLKSDCDYFLDCGNRYEPHLWARSAKDQIALMKALWNSFPDDKKPEWLTYGQIEEYEHKFAGVDWILADASIKAKADNTNAHKSELELGI